MLEKFIKTYSGTYTRTAMVRHKGVVIAFAMDKGRKIWYTILDLNGNIPAAGTTSKFLDVENWSINPTELIFPREIAEVGFGVAGQTVLPLFNRPFSANGVYISGGQSKPMRRVDVKIAGVCLSVNFCALRFCLSCRGPSSEEGE